MKFFNLFLAITFLLATQTTEPAKPKPDPRFGAVESFMAPQQAAQLSVGWDRMIIHWNARQPNSDQDWIVSDNEKAIIATAESSQREIVALLMTTPKWASSNLNGNGVPVGLYLKHDDPNNTWANFVRKVTKEYKGRITHWIIWNEPDIAPEDYGAQFDGDVKDYYQLLKTAYAVAKEVDNKNTIHFAGLTYWHDIVHKRESYLKRLLEVAAKDETAYKNNFYFDVLSAHIYFRPETIPDIVGEYDWMMRLYGLQKPIWLNETNVPPNDDPLFPAKPFIKATMDQQASFIIQANALALASGVERIAVYKLIDIAGPGLGGESYGLFRPDFSPRPAAQAYQLVTTNFSNAQKISISTYSDHQVITILREAGLTRVAWARTERDATLYLSITPNTQATLYNQIGKPITFTVDANNYIIHLPAAICDQEVQRCDIGGAPAILVETYNSPALTSTVAPSLTPLPSPNPKP